MSSNRTIASLTVSLFTASIFTVGAFAQKTDTSVVVKNVPKATAKAAPAPAAATATAPAAGRKTCEDVKASIEEKIKAKGVKAFTLDIVPAADVKDAKVVGNCEAGAKKITYKRG